MTLNTALSAPELAIMRGTPHQGRYYLAYARHLTVATAQINQASFPIPLAQVSVDNASAGWATVREGHTAWIGTTPGSRDIGVYLVRKTPTADTLYLMEIPSGDPGLLALRVPRALQDNAYITIKSAPNLWSVFPRITYTPGGSGSFYKKFDLAYTSQNQTGGAVPCIVNIGEHVAVYVGDGNTYTDTRTATTIFFDGTVASRLWEYDPAGTIVSGSATGASVDIEYPPGNYTVMHTVTTSGGAVVTVERYLWVYDDSTNPVTEIQVFSHTVNDQGASFTAEMIGSLPDDILAGSLVMLWEATDSDSISSATVKAIGFVDSISAATRDSFGIASLTVVSPLGIMDRLRGFSQLLQAVTGTPAHWGQVSVSLSVLDFFVFYLLYWHTTLLRLFDFTTSERNRAKYLWKANTGSWLAAVNSAAELDDLKLTQDSHGNLYLKRDPQMMTTGEKAAVVIRAVLDEDDLVEDSLSFERRLRPNTSKVIGYGLSTDTASDDVAASAAIAAGGAGGQGASEMRIDRLATEAELKVLTGNALAKANNPFPRIGWNIMSNYLLIEPALRYFLPLNITTSQLLPTGEAIAFNTIPTEVNISYTVDREAGAYRSSVGLSAIVDTDGNAAPGKEEPVTARDGLDVFIPDIGLDGLPDLGFDMFLPPIDWGLPPITDIVPDTSTGSSGTPPGSTGIESTELVTWGFVFPVGWRVFYTSDFTAGMSTAWESRTSGGSAVMALPDGTSRKAVYELEDNSLGYTPDIATTNFAELSPIGGSGARLMRQAANGDIVIFGTDGSDNWIRIWNGALGSQINAAASTGGEMSGDVDDFGLGLVVMPANRQLHFYNGSSFVQMTGLPGVTGSAGDEITTVRIPHKRRSGALNNNLAAMELIYGILRKSTRHITYNFNTNSLVSADDISPIISGQSYGIFGIPETTSQSNSYGHALETYAGNANRIIGSFRTVLDNAKLFATSTNGGATWDVRTPVNDHGEGMVHFVEPIRGGNGSKAWRMGPGLDLLWRTTDLFATQIQVALPHQGGSTTGMFQL